jgi:prepilin-type N-terminal cleavage/methylation domain-containing protein
MYRLHRSLRRLSPRAISEGFTLVEVLVVIAIIGVLTAMLLPAVQASREAARRVSCLNNVTQLGLALHSYEFHNETLPPGVVNPDGPIRNEASGQHVSWIVQVLPYMEQQTMWRRFDVEAGAYAEENRPVRTATIRTLLCPSFPDLERLDSNEARSTYGGCQHDVEAPIDADNHGLLFLNSRIRYNDIYDGSSSTILLGECIPPAEAEDLGWVSGTRSTLRNTGALEQPRQPHFTEDGEPTPDQAPSDSTFVGGFGGWHASAVSVAFADGSTRAISYNIDPAVLKLLGHRADGEILSADY